jgi:hypothetical protein
MPCLPAGSPTPRYEPPSAPRKQCPDPEPPAARQRPKTRRVLFTDGCRDSAAADESASTLLAALRSQGGPARLRIGRAWIGPAEVAAFRRPRNLCAPLAIGCTRLTPSPRAVRRLGKVTRSSGIGLEARRQFNGAAAMTASIHLRTRPQAMCQPCEWASGCIDQRGGVECLKSTWCATPIFFL